MDKHPNNSNVITASEIAQYTYCPISWYMKRCGCQPTTQGMIDGLEKHAHVGEKISLVQNKEKSSRYLRLLGYLALVAALLVLAWWLL